MTHEPEELEHYGDDPAITSGDASIPKFLKIAYILLPIWGILTLYFFWNGSTVAWMDGGYWHELQMAANTTFPIENQNMPQTRPEETQSKEKKKDVTNSSKI